MIMLRMNQQAPITLFMALGVGLIAGLVVAKALRKNNDPKQEASMSTDKDVKISYVDVQESSSSKSTDYSMAKSNIPTFIKVLVPDDGKEISDKALNFAISLSNFSGAEIVILRIVENIEKVGDTSISVEEKNGFRYYAGGELVTAMEKKIKKCAEAGAKNKISYEIKVGGNTTEQIVKACEETRYDLVIMTTFHLDSWLKSLFSGARKIISKINTPVLLVQ
jgi:nucleotide-binding universal stress UspA family protein